MAAPAAVPSDSKCGRLGLYTTVVTYLFLYRCVVPTTNAFTCASGRHVASRFMARRAQQYHNTANSWRAQHTNHLQAKPMQRFPTPAFCQGAEVVMVHSCL